MYWDRHFARPSPNFCKGSKGQMWPQLIFDPIRSNFELEHYIWDLKYESTDYSLCTPKVWCSSPLSAVRKWGYDFCHRLCPNWNFYLISCPPQQRLTRRKHIKGWVLCWVWYSDSDISLSVSYLYWGGVKNSEICPRFLTPVPFESFAFRNGATYPKSKTNSASADHRPMFSQNSV